MKARYAILKLNHYSSQKTSPSYRSAHELYKEIGYDFDGLLKQNAAYVNTCATRMSLALIKAGVIVMRTILYRL
jgi:hypothetical protein